MKRAFGFVFSSLFLASSLGFAITESEVAAKFSSEILPWYQTNMKMGEFRGVNQITIRYFAYKTPGAQCVLVYSPGQGEYSAKYAELFYDLKNTGCDLYSIEHRGQGYSQRLIANSQVSYVEHFSDYVEDLSYLVNEIVKPQAYKKSLLLAHSMGGAVASGFLIKYPKVFSEVILSAPMMKINTGKYTQLEATLLANTLLLIGKGQDYAPGQSGYNPNRTAETQTNTSSYSRFNVTRDFENATPQVQIGGAAVRWVTESMGYIEELREVKNLYQVPTFIYQAGQDTLVEPDGQNQVCSRSPQFCQILAFPNSRHEFLRETDSIRDVVLVRIKKALN